MPIPTDPLLAQQWHLHNPVTGLLDLNVLGVWNPAGGGQAYTGAGTYTVVIDDGFDFRHPDLSNYNQDLDYDFEFNTLNAFGAAYEGHGTAVAGIIGAAENGTGAVGVAFDTELIGYRTAGFITDAWLQDIRDAIYYAATTALADVVNISQGISNDTFSEFGVGYNAVRFDEIEASIDTAVDSGRGGLGTTIVKSAGNSRDANFDVNADDWSNDTRQVVVAAVDQNGFVSSYSSYGAAILVSGFGTPGEVLTTDRLGSEGFTSTDFNYGFNGTSSAAPMVAGVAALMYEAAPGLGWRDVQSILAASARHVGSEIGFGLAGSERYPWQWNDAANWNGGGMHFSNDYGYGLVDALAAVRMAETWLFGGQVAQVSNNEFTNTIDLLNAATVIPDGDLDGRTFSGIAAFDDTVERVTVQVTFSTVYTGDLEIYLISPDGTVIELIADNGGTNDFNGTLTFEAQSFRGEGAGGNWSVRIVDDEFGDTLTVSDIVITTYGTSNYNDRYVFTNEYSDYAGTSGHLTAISDANGGTDTINAAAVTSGSIIRLDGAASSIDGVAVTFTNVENAIGGDGNDQIFGNGANNSLYGMRGNDSLNGLGGADTLVGYAGNDTLNGGLGNDALIGGIGNDTYIVDAGDVITEGLNAGVDLVQSAITRTLGANIENLTLTGSTAINGTGNALNNVITGNSANNILNGGLGTDRLVGGLGNDTLNGGLGNDALVGGSGNDTYIVDAGDVITELANGGIDLVQSAITRTLGANIELLTLTGTAAINGTGNALNNTLTGNAANNILDGAAGNDRLIGGAGADTLTGGLGADHFVFRNLSSGVDVISDFNELNGGGEEGDVLRFEGLGVGSFVYLGTGAFSGGSDNSEARVSGNQVLVDTNGDGVTDITITLAGLTNANQLSSADFLFA